MTGRAFISTTADQSAWLIAEAGVVESFLVSPNGSYWLIMQMDGRLALYEGNEEKSAANRSKLLWSENGAPGLGNYFLNMQNDGNLAVWSGKPMTASAYCDPTYWSSGTPLGPGHYFLVVQDDGNVVVYKGFNPLHYSGPLWSRYTGRIVAPATEDRIVIASADLPPCTRMEWQQLYNATLRTARQTGTLYLDLDRQRINEIALEIRSCIDEGIIAGLLAGVITGGEAAIPAAASAFSQCLARKGVQQQIIDSIQFHVETQCHW